MGRTTSQVCLLAVGILAACGGGGGGGPDAGSVSDASAPPDGGSAPDARAPDAQVPDAQAPDAQAPDARVPAQVTAAFVSATADNADHMINAATVGAVTVTVSTAGPVADGDSVVVELDDGTAMASMTAPASASGTTVVAGIDATALADGAIGVRAHVVVGGGVGAAFDGAPATKDTVAPATPSQPDLIAADDSGAFDDDDVTSAGFATFIGTADPDVDVALLVDGAATSGGIAGVGGDYTLAGSLPEGTVAVTVVAVDAAGNPSAPSPPLSVTVDTTAPADPTDVRVPAGTQNPVHMINAATAAAVVVSVTSEVAATDTVEARVSVGATSTMGSITGASGAGPHDVTIDATGFADTAPGGVQLAARVVDLAGNVNPGGFVAGTPATKDTVAPATPAAPDLLAADDSGASSTDDVTAVATPRLTGSAEPAAAVELAADGVVAGTSAADGAGAFTIAPAAALGDGARALTVRAIDAAGNRSGSSPALVVTIDTVAPATPAAPDLAAASDSGPSNTDDYTNDTTPTLAGSAEAAALVSVYRDGVLLATATASGAGAWSVTAPALADGSFAITATATDLAGNTSVASAALALTIDTDVATPGAPDLAAASDLGASSTDDLTADTTPTFVGTVEPGAVVALTEGATPRGSATAGADGSYAVTSAALSHGAHALRVAQTDRAGNASAASPALTVDIDAAAPSLVLASRLPAPGAALVPAGTNLELAFSEPMNPASITADTWYVAGQQGAGAVFQRAAAAFTLVADPDGDGVVENADLLASGAAITVVVDGVEDLAGNPAPAASWGFTTRDRTPPNVIARSPAALVPPIDAATWTGVTVQFDEAMDASRGRCRVERADIDKTAAAASISGEQEGATLAWATTALPGDTLVMTFTTFAPPPGQSFEVSCEDVFDVDGNAFHEPAAPVDQFRVGVAYHVLTANPSDTTAPDVVSRLPEPGATGVDAAPMIAITFSEPIDVTTLADIRVSDSSGDITSSLQMQQAFNTVFLAARAALPAGETITVTVPTTLLDAGGNALAADRSFVFTVGAEVDVGAPVLGASAPADGELEVPRAGYAMGFALRDGADGAPEFPRLDGSLQDSFLLVDDATGIPVKGWQVSGQDLQSEIAVRPTPEAPLPLAAATTYTAIVSGVADRAGNAMTGASFSFTTQTSDADAAPYIDRVYPRVDLVRWSNGNVTVRWDLRARPIDPGQQVTVTSAGPGGWSATVGPYTGTDYFDYRTFTAAGSDAGNEPELAALGAGFYELQFTAVDAAANTVTRVTELYLWDTTPVAIAPVDGAATGTTTPTLSWTGVDVANADALLLSIKDATGRDVLMVILAPSITSFTVAPEAALSAAGNPYTWNLAQIRFHQGVDGTHAGAAQQTTPAPPGATTTFTVP